MRAEVERSRRARLAAAAILVLSMFGAALVLVFSGEAPPPPAALRPLETTKPSEPTEPPGPGYPVASSATQTAALPALELPPFPAGPTIDWQAALQPYIRSRIDAAAADMAGSIAGAAGPNAANPAALTFSDLIRYAAYSKDGRELLAQLQGAAPALLLSASALPPPDLSGLSAAFAAAAAQPPFGVPGPPRQPTPPPIGLPAVGLPSIARLFGLSF